MLQQQKWKKEEILKEDYNKNFKKNVNFPLNKDSKINENID